jgi:predicted ribosome quality control (RQC) complex YloA/Tae2 family protein
VDLATVTAIRPELESELVGRRFGKVFQLSRSDLAVDFRLSGSRYLFVSLRPGNPRTYLIERRLRDLDKAAINPGAFPLVLRKHLSGAEVSSVTQVESERVLLIGLDGSDELDRRASYILALQLTGSSSNMFLLDSGGAIIDSMKETRGPGQQIGDRYDPPARSEGQNVHLQTAVHTGSISKRLDAEDLARSTADRFRSLAISARNKLKQEISKRRKLVRALNEDLAGHGNADQWKRFGDLLLANVSNARRDGERVFVTDYFDPALPEIAIDVDNNESITEAAEKFFRKYTKARNAGKEIQGRLRQVEKELVTLESKAGELDELIATGDEARLLEFVGEKRGPKKVVRRKRAETPSGIRTFISSDGYEILVGKKAKDNDHLTFRVARSLDTWMHAADYPGSHVVVRNPNRKEIPHRTMVEAAQLAAFYSQGKKQPKAAVHYTQKKFVNKPKGSAPGLVSLASFKTLLVEPKIGEVALKTN